MIVSLLICIFTTVLLSAALSASSVHRAFLFKLCAVQWLALFLSLVYFNSSQPFTDGGDDWGYFALVISISSFREAFDPYFYLGLLEQPGYPMLLAPFSFLSSGNLLALKAVNLSCFIVLTAVWSRVGHELHGERFARVVGIFVALLAPLWYYAFFLLKDMPIATLQGVAVLGGVLICNRKLATGMLLVLISTVLLIPLRSFLALINIAIVGVSLLGMYRAATRQRLHAGASSKLLLAGGLLVGSAAAYAVLSGELIAYMGVLTETRKLSFENIATQAEMREADSMMRRAIFPILYFVSETAGIRALWLGSDQSSEVLRGLFAVPWILFYLPFLAVGIYFLMTRLRLSETRASAWLPVISLGVIYMVVSWTGGDTTRWRLPDFPALATVASLGFSQLQAKNRFLVLLWWSLAVLGSATIFYLILQ